MEKKFNFFAVLSISIVIVLGLGVFVIASLAVTNVEIKNNVTFQFDEGNFSINWTNATQDSNYTIYVYVNSTTAFVYAITNSSGFVNDSINSSGTARGATFGNFTEGNYTFIIEAKNTTAGGGSNYSNFTNISMYIDRTDPPTIELRNSDGTIYTNATYKNQNDSALTSLNISISDVRAGFSSSGLTGAVCLIDVNGTNQTVTVDSGWCNSTVLNLTGLADGNQTINVYVNDTVNNVGLNNSFVVFVDSTDPTATTSCTPANPTDNGELVTCTCSGSDGSGTGIASETANRVDTASTGGTFTYDCTVEDNAGNTGIATATYLVQGTGTTTTTSSSGSSGTTTSAKSTTFTKITPDKASIFKNFNADTGVKEIQINVNNEVKNVKVTVTKYDSKPSAVSVEKKGKVYQYLQIDATNLGNNLDKATVQFKVEKSWISSNGLDKDKISVSKFNEDSKEWNELSTVYSNSDDTYDYFDVELTSFSYFAISEKTVVEEEETSVLEEISETIGDIGEGVKKNLTWVWVIIAVLVFLVVVFMNKEKINFLKR
tara:strand:- start:7198 stop:8832 length:1635 start_codon:yes stop_codon:yes gene_type:complete